MTILEKSVQGNVKDKEKLAEYFRDFIGPQVLLFEPLSIATLATLLDENERALSASLRRLRAVFAVPDRKTDTADQTEMPIKILHPSFRDCLTSKDRCDPRFLVDPGRTHRLLLGHCLGRAGALLKRDMCDLRLPGAWAEDVKPEVVARCIPPHLKYACVYWARHLMAASDPPVQDDGPTYRFLTRHFLHWLEALSLARRISDGIGPLFQLGSLLTVRTSLPTTEVPITRLEGCY